MNEFENRRRELVALAITISTTVPFLVCSCDNKTPSTATSFPSPQPASTTRMAVSGNSVELPEYYGVYAVCGDKTHGHTGMIELSTRNGMLGLCPAAEFLVYNK